MLRGLTTAASGMVAAERLQESLTNNLANSQTAGFKATDGQLLSFPEQLQRLTDYGSGSPIATVGKMGTGVAFQEGVPLFSQGQLVSSGRNLDVAIVDGTPAGTYAAVAANPGGQQTGANPTQPTMQSVEGTVIAGANGQLEVNGSPLAVIGPKGQPMQGVFAMKNPQYQGTALIASNGMPDYDANGQPSYVFSDANGNVVGHVGDQTWQQAGIRVGSQDDMGPHSFYAVAFSSPEGAKGVALTRNGQFDVTSDNLLIDANHNYILPIDANGMPMANARIQVNPNYQGTDLFNPDGSPVVDAQGQPSYRIVDPNGNPLGQGRLGTVDADVTNLTPLGQTEFMVGQTLNPTTVQNYLQPTTGTIKPGQMEQSNVDVTSTMVSMMAVINQYEANQRVVRTYDTELQKAVDDVGKVNA